MKKQVLFAACAAAALTLAGCAGSSAVSTSGSSAKAAAVTPSAGQYVLVVNGYDWGPGVDKVVLNVGKTVSSDAVTADEFTVSVSMQGLDWSTFQMGSVSGTRTVSAAYTSDAQGNPVSTDSEYVALELPVHPADSLSNPFVFCMDMMNRWSDPYSVTIENKALEVSVSECAGRVSPLADQFTMSTITTGDITLSYAAWEPAKHGKKTPLIIWLHGMGEGGQDPYVAILGNKVVNLITPEIQKCFGADGAYVLAPQVDGFWLQTDASKEMKAAQSEDTPARSYYTEALFNLIDTYVKANPDIDPNRIYVGGCSNGGYMTVNMLIEYPDYFAAAYPVCEAYPDSKIDDEKLSRLASQHIWFTAAKNDTTVNPDLFVVATTNRIAEKYPDADIHFSFFDDVHDTTGQFKNIFGEGVGEPYQYMGHWSWIYTLNNECVDGDVTVMEWLAKQSK